MANCTQVLLLFLLFSAQTAQQTQPNYQTLSPKKNERCIICDKPLAPDDVVLLVRGRRVPLKRAMLDSFLNNPEKYFAELQPKGALVQENLEAPAGVAQGGISLGWFLFGAYVLVGLVFAGLSSYLAVAKGLRPIPHFFISLFFNAFGLLYVLSRRSVVSAGQVPAGLAKVPATAAPMACPGCGTPNHPAATRCAGCGATLQAAYESEAARTRRS